MFSILSNILPFLTNTPIFSYWKWIVGVIAVVALGLLFWSWQARGKEIDSLKTEVSVLQSTVTTLKKEAENIQKAHNEHTKIVEKTEQESKNLSKKFNKNNRDFGNLAYKKPKLVEKRINNAIKARKDCIFSITLGTLTCGLPTATK